MTEFDVFVTKSVPQFGSDPTPAKCGATNTQPARTRHASTICAYVKYFFGSKKVKCSRAIRGRYVGIKFLNLPNRQDRVLRLCEFQVMEDISKLSIEVWESFLQFNIHLFVTRSYNAQFAILNSKS